MGLIIYGFLFILLACILFRWHTLSRNIQPSYSLKSPLVFVPLTFVIMAIVTRFILGSYIAMPAAVVLVFMLITFALMDRLTAWYISKIASSHTLISPQTLHKIGLILFSLSIALVFFSDLWVVLIEYDYIELGLVNLIASFFLYVPWLLIYAVVNGFHNLILNKKQTSFQQKVTRTRPTTQLTQHYREQGMSDEEIAYFRKQMEDARTHIYALEDSFPQTAKLRTIEKRHNTIEVCQSYFKHIVERPQSISQAGDFLYKYLPNLHDLADKYNEISQHVAKNKQTYQILDRSAQVIEELCEEIHDDYIAFHKETYDNLEDEIRFAEKNLNKGDDFHV